ncbi:amidase signature enzyme [Pleomassaria siparia CBS 279.74]|uniref:Amidase signature enzyme n=1 Tax=Pleomassaria siparia CBS 279.74 TaxID=1314801 RepID=A0A6G1KMU5_9PLEO|nr:amidase signature enzyme [Pleomassaria siparia CBS 279.74]
MSEFDIVEASIADHKKALDSGIVTSVSLVTAYLLRIAKYDTTLNAFTLINPSVLEEAAASDAYRASGLPPRALEGIPYTLKDSFKYTGLTVTNGSPALAGLQSNEDSTIAKRLRNAGAVLVGKTNMPPMAAGGMQRGLYGRAESPYNSKYLTAAFSSGSSNGAATSTASSMAVFAMGSETVSSGRSPASNNALVAYTPSRGILSCRGLWPLYVTCDVPVPYARSVKDLLQILAVIAVPEDETKGDLWREQKSIELPRAPKVNYASLENTESLAGKRIGVPKMYVGMKDADPHAKPTVVSPEVLRLWETARADLEALGAEIVYTDFPLVTNYENDSVSKETNNVVGAPSNWNANERGILIAKAWDEFLVQNNDAKISSLEDVDPLLLFPKPKDYLPDTWLEVRNWIGYAQLPELAAKYKDTPLIDIPGLPQALKSLEAQRKRDLEEWMDEQNLDVVAFPANGDVGLADLEFDLESARHSLQNGVKYSHGNRAIRHLGVPTVSVPMGVMNERKMPVNLTFAGKAHDDAKLLEFAYAYEQLSKRRISPPLTPKLVSDTLGSAGFKQSGESTSQKLEVHASATASKEDGIVNVKITGNLKGPPATVEVFLYGTKAWSSKVQTGPWDAVVKSKQTNLAILSWDLQPLPPRPVMVIVIARTESGATATKLLWAF